MFAGLVPFLVFWCHVANGVKDFGQEPLCLSRYDYDYKILRNIVALEQKDDELQREVINQKYALESQKDVIESQKDDLETQKDVNNKQNQEIEQMRASQTGMFFFS